MGGEEQKELCYAIHAVTSLNSEVVSDMLNITLKEAKELQSFMLQTEHNFCNLDDYVRLYAEDKGFEKIIG